MPRIRRKPLCVRLSAGAFIMTSLLEQALEWLGLAGVAGLAAFIPWGKLGVGIGLTVFAAFFPNVKRSTAPEPVNAESATSSPPADEPDASPSTQTTSSGSFARGAFRLACVVAGITLLVGAVGDGHQSYIAHSRIGPVRGGEEVTSRWNGNEPASRYYNAPPAATDSTADRTRVRSENKPLPTVTSTSASKAETNTPASQWKFLHK
jgi:hypothetical protein